MELAAHRGIVRASAPKHGDQGHAARALWMLDRAAHEALFGGPAWLR